MDEPATALAAFCTEDLTADSLETAVRERAKAFLLDTIGVGLRATEYRSSASVLAAVDRLRDGGGPATVWGTGRTAAVDDAAFVNASLVHTPELDETHRAGVVHSAASVVPTALAVAEREGADGGALLAGIVGGFDVAVRLALALPSHRHRFHTTATCGVFGATAAGAIVGGASRDELVDAFGVNVSQAAGSGQWIENGAWTKRIHPGLAARNATLSLALARSGFRGSAEPLTGEDGFLALYGEDPSPERLTRGLGDTYHVMAAGFKPYACCRYNHAAIDLTLDLVREHDVDPADVERVTLWGSEPVAALSRPEAVKSRPRNVVDAQFSPQYAIAVAVVDRAAGVDQFAPERLDDPALHEVMDRVAVREDAAMTAQHPAEWPSRVEIELADRTVSAERERPRGEPEDPLSDAELEGKFRTLAAPVAGEELAADLVAAVDGVDDDGGLERLTSLLRRVEAPGR